MQARIAPSLGALEGTHQEVWGTTEYLSTDEPTVFMGLYGLNDFYALWRHKGPKYIFWCGSDITHFINGYWLDDVGLLRIGREGLAQWINTYCESWVENEVEQKALMKVGILAKVGPSFMGQIDAYDISYKHSDIPKVYASVSGDDFLLYGWQKINILAMKNPGIEFHLYGNTKPWKTQSGNVFVHGRVPKEQMNEEIRHMQGGLRLLEFDGFSEIIAKSVLWGQYPISMIEYPYTLKVSEIWKLKEKKAPNIDGAVYYRIHLNKYPWNSYD